jgi:nucleotide-binding universal stress UspA family protein
MKIAVFIDFSDGSKVALQQALLLCSAKQGKILAINIVADEDKKAEVAQKLSEFVQASNTNQVAIDIAVGVGDLFAESKRVLFTFNPNYVFICTHGVKGIVQTLFGAFIVKLVQSIPYPSIVFQENNSVQFNQIQKIIFPISEHEKFELKMEEATKIAQLYGATVHIYYINKPSLGDEERKLANIRNAVNHFENAGVKYEVVEEDVLFFSAGYAKQTLDYCKRNQIQLITLLATVPERDPFMNEADKENFIMNEQGIPVICCNG